MQTGSRERVFWGSLVLLLLVIISAGSYASFLKMVRNEREGKAKRAESQWNVPESPTVRDTMNLLLIGVDNVDGSSRSDTLMFARLDKGAKTVRILSIPRDTRVHIPGRRWDKITHAHAYGGVDLTRSTVEELLGMPVDHYVKLDFDGFESVVDKLGGVRMGIDKPMRYTDRAGGLHIDLKAGYQLLGGKAALGYVRFRHDAMGDIGRVARQEGFMKALMEQAFKPGNLVKLPGVIRQAWKSLDTDLSMMDTLTLAKAFRKMAPGAMVSEILPGRPGYIGGVSYWLPDDAALDDKVSELKGGKPAFECTVDVLNGCGVTGAARAVADKLEEEGFTIGRVDNFPEGNVAVTRILDLEGDPEPIDRLYSVLDPTTTEYTMDLGGKSLDPSLRTKASIVIIVGKDTQLR